MAPPLSPIVLRSQNGVRQCARALLSQVAFCTATASCWNQTVVLAIKVAEVSAVAQAYVNSNSSNAHLARRIYAVAAQKVQMGKAKIASSIGCRQHKQVAPDRPSMIPGVARRCLCTTLRAQTALLAHGTALQSTPVRLTALFTGSQSPAVKVSKKLRESTLHSTAEV